jgi:hypothetical protein
MTRRKTRPDGDRRLDIEVAANHLLAGLVEAVGAAAPQCDDGGATVLSLLVAPSSAPTPGTVESAAAMLSPMLVDFVLEPDESLRVGGRRSRDPLCLRPRRA